jgi:hypothetical protein
MKGIAIHLDENCHSIGIRIANQRESENEIAIQ